MNRGTHNCEFGISATVIPDGMESSQIWSFSDAPTHCTTMGEQTEAWEYTGFAAPFKMPD